ncbi:hypothetical protein [Glaciecola sp. SC05]|uniref:hypothetical protein n=1 Tax=Glaciecola sp. SC05 TaxID=1987355 RepID=UPI0035274DCA
MVSESVDSYRLQNAELRDNIDAAVQGIADENSLGKSMRIMRFSFAATQIFPERHRN